MAGMLPGVESARRRRIHQSGGSLDSSSSITSTSLFGHGSRRSSTFCLYAANNHESPHLYSMQRNPAILLTVLNVKLEETAREAKERLDEKLNAQWKSQKTRSSNKCQQRIQTEVSTPTKIVSKRFSWVAKLRWKSAEDAECAVCLDNFKARQTLMELPCNHRFHSRCLLPWLATNAHCPCCRLQIFK